jgi:hypothetical protein
MIHPCRTPLGSSAPVYPQLLFAKLVFSNLKVREHSSSLRMTESIMDFHHVNEALIESYQDLRKRIGILAFAFPLILVVVGYLWSIDIQPTLSNYYFANDPVRIDHTPIRLWFCGILFIVSFFLYRYHGFSKNEDRWLSFAGVCALGVAVCPMSMDGKDEYGFVLAWIGLTQFSLHYIFAVTAFVCIAMVIVWYADQTLSQIRDSNPTAYKRYKNIYRAIAGYMIFSIALSFYLNHAHHGQGAYILLAETSGIWAFAFYWFVKNREMTEVGRELKRRNATLSARTGADLTDKI